MLALYGHPFSSYTQKTLIALWENETVFELRTLEAPEHGAEWLRRWPLKRFPLLLDGERQVVETSIILEYLQLTHPGPVRLLPEDPMAALQVRFMDRFFDLHVMEAMQVAVDAALGRGMKREDGVALAQERLERAYAWLEGELAGKTWATGQDFTMADCAAAPSLFYADWVHRISEHYPLLRAYRARLLARPSIARAVDGGRPYRHLFPWARPTAIEHDATFENHRGARPMGLLTFSLNLTLDGCVDHQEGIVDDETHALFTRLMDQGGAMLWGRVTYEMMESYWPKVARGEVEAPPALREWAVKLEAKPKYVVSSTRSDFPWTNSQHLTGDLRTGVQKLKEATPVGVLLGSGKLATELDRLELIDEYLFLVHPRIAGHGPTLYASGLPSTRRLELISAKPLRCGAVAMHYRRAR